MQALRWLWATVISTWAGSAHAQAICAEVKIEIQQTVSLERQAFNARLGVDNSVDLPITELDVDIEFRDAQGNTVIGTFDPNNSAALFFIRDDGSIGVTGGSTGAGTLPGSSSGELRWLIIPSGSAGGSTAQGQFYAIGARVSFMQGGEARSISVMPDTIDAGHHCGDAAAEAEAGLLPDHRRVCRRPVHARG